MSACEKGGQWQCALMLLADMGRAQMTANMISFSAAMLACERGGQWQCAVLLLEDMGQAQVSADVTIFNAVASACDKGGQWQRVLSLFQLRFQMSLLDESYATCDSG